MALTISELEAERAKILDEIESKASNLSQKTPSSEGSMSLNDWLTAAEEVMPETSKPKQKSHYSDKVLSSTKGTSRNSFFGVVIMLSLLLTILGVVYIAYSSIHKELQSVLVLKDDNVQQMKALQEQMKSLQETVASGGKSEVFVKLEDKVLLLESEVQTLKEQLTQISSQKVVVSSANAQPAAEGADAGAVAKPASDGVVTEAILDQKLKTYTEQLEQRIDRKLEVILNHLTKDNPQAAQELSTINDKPVASKADKGLDIETPAVATVKTPVVEAPLVKLISKVKTPVAPEAPAAPIVNASEDVKWIMQQPKQHYILQLASMPDAASLKKIVRSKQLKDTKILPQTRNGVTNYVLVTGSFADRAKANALAKQVKSETGVSPWIRKVKDLSGRIQ